MTSWTRHHFGTYSNRAWVIAIEQLITAIVHLTLQSCRFEDRDVPKKGEKYEAAKENKESGIFTNCYGEDPMTGRPQAEIGVREMPLS